MRKLLFIYFALYFLTNINCTIQAQIITTIAGGATGHGGYWGEGGQATAAELATDGTIGVDIFGNVYIGDGSRILKVDVATGIISTAVGTGVNGFNGDGMPATAAQINLAAYPVFDHFNNLYIGDGENNRIRKVDGITWLIGTFAGNGVLGCSGNGAPATDAEIYVGAITWDLFGNFYMGDKRQIRKIDSFGEITTIAGTGLPGSIGEGVPATSTNMGFPYGIATDIFGNVFYADSTGAVRKVTIATGIINRVAGTGDNIRSPYSGDGMPATSCHICPEGIYLDNLGNLYIADDCNNRIEKVDTFGIIYTVAGSGTPGYSGDGEPATVAEINYPQNIALDPCGNLYISDFNNARVRKVTFDTTCNLATLSIKKSPENPTFTLYPNPANDVIIITAQATITHITISNLLGQAYPVPCPYLNTGEVRVDVAGLPAGVYMVRITDSEGREAIRLLMING